MEWELGIALQYPSLPPTHPHPCGPQPLYSKVNQNPRILDERQISEMSKITWNSECSWFFLYSHPAAQPTLWQVWARLCFDWDLVSQNENGTFDTKFSFKHCQTEVWKICFSFLHGFVPLSITCMKIFWISSKRANTQLQLSGKRRDLQYLLPSPPSKRYHTFHINCYLVFAIATIITIVKMPELLFCHNCHNCHNCRNVMIITIITIFTIVYFSIVPSGESQHSPLPCHIWHWLIDIGHDITVNAEHVLQRFLNYYLSPEASRQHPLWHNNIPILNTCIVHVIQYPPAPGGGIFPRNMRKISVIGKIILGILILW